MQILNLVQGSPEWKATRAKYHTASEAPAMKGKSKYKKRDQLIHEKAEGEEQEFDDFTLKLFEKGHEIEKMARPHAEKIIGEPLFPATGLEIVDGIGLLSSFDGVTMATDLIWECKSWNLQKAADLRDGKIPETDIDQVIQQLVTSGAEKCLYMVTDGTPEKMVYIWYYLTPNDKPELIAGWKQFNQDLSDYVTNDKPTQKGVSSAIMELPAIKIDIIGGVKESNLAIYKDSAEQFIASINTDLVTDDDFATAETTIKFCETTEKKLDLVKTQAIEQATGIDELFKTIDFLKEQIRSKRLSLNKTVTSKKAEIKMKIALDAKNEFISFQAEINEKLGGNYVFVETDFNSALKNKRTIDSLQSAANDEVANCKIKANEIAQKVQYNLEAIPSNREFLFTDKTQIATKENDDFILLVNARVDKYEKEQEERIAAKRLADEKAAQTEPATIKEVEPETIPDNIIDSLEFRDNESKFEEAKISPDSWKVVAASLQANGIGLKSANKIARLIVDDKIDNVKFFSVVLDMAGK